jgi:hypothetical protein
MKYFSLEIPHSHLTNKSIIMLKNILKYNSIFLLTLFIFIGQSNVSAQAKWEKHYSENGKFEIKIPGLVEENVLSEETTTTYKFHLQGGETEYLATGTVHEYNLDIDSLDLETVSLESFAETVKGNIAQKSAWKVGKYSGIKAIIENDQLYIDYRILIIGNMQFQVVAYAPPGKFDTKSAGKYFKSFKLKL